MNSTWQIKKIVKRAVVILSVIGIFAFISPSPSYIYNYLTASYRACKKNYLSEADIKAYIARAEQGDKSVFKPLEDYYWFCNKNKAEDIKEIAQLHNKYQFLDDDSVLAKTAWSNSVQRLNFNEYREVFNYYERTAINESAARILLSEIYKYDSSEEFGDNSNLPKSLYYSKLDGCDTNKEYSYASYLHTLFHNYPDNKEYVKVAYAMLLFTKFNANQFYNYSKFDALEQNMTSRLDAKGVSYIIHNYQSIIAKECEGILADHSQVPTEAKLMQYAFPLKSDGSQDFITKD